MQWRRVDEIEQGFHRMKMCMTQQYYIALDYHIIIIWFYNSCSWKYFQVYACTLLIVASSCRCRGTTHIQPTEKIFFQGQITLKKFFCIKFHILCDTKCFTAFTFCHQCETVDLIAFKYHFHFCMRQNYVCQFQAHSFRCA